MSASPQPASHVVAVVFSAAGLKPLLLTLGALPATFQGAVVLVQHTGAKTELPGILERHLQLGVKLAVADDLLCSATVYVCPPRHHVFVRPDRTIGLSTAAPIRLMQPCGDWLLESTAAVYGPCAVGVVLSGRLSDGSRGVVWIKRGGGMVIAQRPSTCGFSSMPAAAIRTGCVDLVLAPDEIAAALQVAVANPDASRHTRAWQEPFAVN